MKLVESLLLKVNLFSKNTCMNILNELTTHNYFRSPIWGHVLQQDETIPSGASSVLLML